MIKLSRPECPKPEALADKDYNHPDNKAALKSASNNKCMYCESEVLTVDHGEIEHFRPRSKYPALIYDWNNLGFVCHRCNHAKLAKFDEGTPYIDPYSEDPENHILFCGFEARPFRQCERGELTISDIQLNRPDLRESRIEKLKEIDAFIITWNSKNNDRLKEKALEELIKLSRPGHKYSSMVKTYLRLQQLL
ncbi:HNH endonuclease [Vibrio sp. RE88]|uniref:HNH endonuclease n=1 Tax=Vibrio sp. RE88 TaxID=2607610 RepID=UPI001493B7A6|nr:HNH endonuclease [Vibrio sp. RE88]NOH60315.1 HNH endonuclease [Vibrio sp. RE88]